MTDLQRLKSLQKEIIEKKLDGVILIYSRDVFYYTGTAQPSFLVVLPDDYLLFVKSGIDFVRAEANIDPGKIRQERQIQAVFETCFQKPNFFHIATELDVLTANQHLTYQKVFAGFEISDISPFVLGQRKTKDEDEILRIRQACSAIDAGHQAVISGKLVGFTELEIAARIEHAHRLAGHDGCFFFRLPDFFMSRGPMASGDNLSKMSGVVYSITGVGLSSSVPLGPSQRIIRRGDPVMVDIPTSVNGYHADQTRTYFVGKAPHELKELYEKLTTIHETLLETIRPGQRCQDIYAMALEVADHLGVGDVFLNFGKGKKSQLIGHGIGLEVNEPPIISSYSQETIGENHVIAIEMHLYKEQVGVVKLEDTLWIGKNRNEVLTTSSRELFEL